MSNGVLLTARDAWVQVFAEALPNLRACLPHPGLFDLDEAQELAVRAPAVLTALTGVGKLSESGEGVLDCEADFAAFILTSDNKRLYRDQAAINLVEGVIKTIRSKAPAQNDSAPVMADMISDVKNLYSGGMRRQGVSVWSVYWMQRLRISQGAKAEEALDLTAYLGWAPEIGPDHQPDYEELSGHA